MWPHKACSSFTSSSPSCPVLPFFNSDCSPFFCIRISSFFFSSFLKLNYRLSESPLLRLSKVLLFMFTLWRPRSTNCCPVSHVRILPFLSGWDGMKLSAYIDFLLTMWNCKTSNFIWNFITRNFLTFNFVILKYSKNF